MTGTRNDYQVLIVGAGPVGVLCGLLLGRYGVRTAIIDRAPEIMDIPRAISFDNEALRVLQAAGVMERLREHLPAVPCAQMVSPFVGDIMRINTRGVVDGQPKVVAVYQPGVERVLRDALSRQPSVTLQGGLECAELRDEGERVSARCQTADGQTRRISADYVIGADGANSFVRKSLGIGFQGLTYQEDWLIVDVAFTPRERLEHVQFFCNPQRPNVHVPGPDGSQRWEFMLMPGETREQMERPETVRALMAPWGDISTMQVLRQAVYRFHARTADRIRCGRILLAGDAAHVTPPFAGQGLCAGLRDAHNLTWKLAWVLRGQAGESILDSYQTERLPHVRKMIKLAVLMGRTIMPTSRIYARLRDYVMRLLRLLPPLRAFFEEMKIKPDSAFRRGLFLPRRLRGCVLKPGSPMPQGILRRADGSLAWADDVMGCGLILIGFGVDPLHRLDTGTRTRWVTAGGDAVFLRARQQNLAGLPPALSPVLEDETGVYVGELAPAGTVAIVRPDRIVMGVAALADATRLVHEALDLIGSAASAQAPRPAAAESAAGQAA